jgi:NAD(P)-dependent dehydrogenase (short-subunit alcohol dehydrogenase family)
MADLSRFDLSGRKALVTGASRGIGRRLAVGLAQAGADIAVAARSAHALADTVRDIQALGRHAVAVELDVREVAQCRLAAEQAAATLGDLDILVNNAGVEEVRPSLEVERPLGQDPRHQPERRILLRPGAASS